MLIYCLLHIKIKGIILERLAVLLQYYKDFNMIWIKVWVKLTNSYKFVNWQTSDTQCVWFDLSVMILLRSSVQAGAGRAGLSCCCSSTWHPENVGSRGTDQKYCSQMDNLAPTSAALKLQLWRCRWIKKQSVIYFLCVQYLLLSYTLNKQDLSLFNSFVCYNYCSGWTRAF